MDFRKLNLTLLPKIRLTIYAVAFLLLVASYFISAGTKGFASIELANDAGFLSFAFISLALVVTPLRVVLPQFPFNSSLNYGRRAFGVSAFIFALVHYVLQMNFLFNWDVAKVLQSDGFTGNAFLAGYVALAILFILSITSFDWVVQKLGKKWYALHKLVYLAYPLIIYHAVKIGLDFQNVNLYSGLFFTVAGITIILEIARLYKTFSKKPASTTSTQATPTETTEPTRPTSP